MFIRQNEQEVIDIWMSKMLVYLSFFLFFSHQLYIADDKLHLQLSSNTGLSLRTRPTNIIIPVHLVLLHAQSITIEFF